MRNWERDGWTEQDWDAVVGRTATLRAVALRLDDAAGGGGGGLSPREVAEFAEQALLAAQRLKQVAAAYMYAT